MTDLRLNSSGDLDLTGDALALTPTFTEAISQHIKIRLRFFLGEWFLNTSLGIPYFERIMVKTPDLQAISAIFQEAITETAGIDSVLQFKLDLDTITRALTVTFTAKMVGSDEILDFSNVIKIDSFSVV